jgi:hypothetical protein
VETLFSTEMESLLEAGNAIAAHLLLLEVLITRRPFLFFCFSSGVGFVFGFVLVLLS